MNEYCKIDEGISAFLLPWKLTGISILLVVGLSLGIGGHANAFSVEPGETCIVGVSTGGHHTCILQADGNVDCYGYNEYGQSEDYTNRDAISVSAGGYHTCILKANGNVDCYGFNEYGQAKDYNEGDAIKISAGVYNTCILKDDGNIYCYGQKGYGQAKEFNSGDAISVSTGGYHTCILRTDGNVICSGYDEYGQTAGYTGGDAVDVSVGGYHTCILKANGNVDCFGYNAYGQVVDYAGGDAIGVSAGGFHTCILKSDGNVNCFGYNMFGQTINYNGGDVIRISTDTFHTCILKSDGNVACSGNNDCGQASCYTNEDAACSYHQPEVTTATIDIVNDLFQVEITGGQTSREPENVFLEAVIKVKEGYFAWDIDPTTITLSTNGITLATAEETQIIDNILMIKFRLNLNNVGIILNMNVNEVVINKGNVKIKADSVPATSIDLIDLTISGNIFGGGSFSCTDAICVTH